MTKDFYDVIIIGSGAAGAAAAWNLSNKGLKIICLEQGSYTNPDFYPKNKSDISDINDYNYLIEDCKPTVVIVSNNTLHRKLEKKTLLSCYMKTDTKNSNNFINYLEPIKN